MCAQFVLKTSRVVVIAQHLTAGINFAKNVLRVWQDILNSFYARCVGKFITIIIIGSRNIICAASRAMQLRLDAGRHV